MKKLKSIFFLVIALLVIGCSTDDVEVIEDKMNEENSIIEGAGSKVGVSLIYEEMVFPQEMPQAEIDSIIGYYLNKYPEMTIHFNTGTLIYVLSRPLNSTGLSLAIELETDTRFVIVPYTSDPPPKVEPGGEGDDPDNLWVRMQF